MFLMGRWGHTTIKKIKEFKIEERSTLKWVKNRDKTNIQTKSFIPKSIRDYEKYIPTTKYITITPPQKIQEKHFWVPFF